MLRMHIKILKIICSFLNHMPTDNFLLIFMSACKCYFASQTKIQQLVKEWKIKGSDDNEWKEKTEENSENQENRRGSIAKREQQTFF